MPGPLGRDPENRVFTNSYYKELAVGLVPDFLTRSLRLLADISFVVKTKELNYYVQSANRSLC